MCPDLTFHPMQATVTDHRCDIAVLHLRGELDADTAGALRATLADLGFRGAPTTAEPTVAVC